MDDEEYKRKLSEVAEWHIPKLKDWEIDLAKQKARGRGRPSNEELYQDEHQQIFLEIFNGVNPTAAPEVTKVKVAATICDDCGSHCPEGRKTEAKLHQKNGKTAWRQKCVTCNRFQNPFNGCFELTGSAASIKFNDFMRETKGAYKTQGNEKRSQVLIRKYPDTKDPL